MGSTLPLNRPQTVSAPWLQQPGLVRIFSALGNDPQTVRVNGGAVRDTLLGRPIGDVDLSTTYLPGDVVERVQRAGLKAVPTGIEHGTVTVVADSLPYQVTTLREDVETDGRHAVVRFGTDWSRDALRRDFTMNALYLGPDGSLHDPLDGYSDCLGQYVRFIGDADQRIREDYLRILRFFRFQASHGTDVFDPEALAAIGRQVDGLASISRERIGIELRKMLLADGAIRSLQLMQQTQVLEAVLPGVPVNMEHLIRFRALIDQFKCGAPWTAHLAALISHRAHGAWNLLGPLKELLRLSNAEKASLDGLLKPLDRVPVTDPEGVYTLAYRLEPERAGARLLLEWAGSSQALDDETWLNAYNLLLATTPQPLPISGSDLMNAGVPAGASLGQALKAAEACWIASGFQADREGLLRQAVTKAG